MMARSSLLATAMAPAMALALAVSACGGPDSGGALEPPDGTGEPGGGQASIVAAEVLEWQVVAQPAMAPAGPVSFEVANTGTMEHEFVVVRTDQAPDQLPVEGGVVDETQIDIAGEIEPFPAGEERDATIFLSAGPHVLICNIPGHYQQGMRLGFDVA